MPLHGHLGLPCIWPGFARDLSLSGATAGFVAVLAPFGAFALNFSATTAAICMGPVAHDDKARRCTAAVVCGGIFVLIGLIGAFGAVVTGLLTPLRGVLAGGVGPGGAEHGPPGRAPLMWADWLLVCS